MNNYTAKILQAAFIIVAITGTSSCNNDPIDTKVIAEEQNEQKFDSKETEKDAQFLVDAAAISLEEISLGHLARLKGNTSHLRELGKLMEDDHAISLKDLTDLAKTKNVSLPTSATENEQDIYEKLAKKSGVDFGKAYSDKMVSGHKDAIALFEKASVECNDLAIRAWATSTLPTLRNHLGHSIMCQKECETM